uniref:phytanoyl-CoA dioxygenase n=1 Tax=Heliothis virescens TaxID=7102 RepID=A0A2A4K938_HELVI
MANRNFKVIPKCVSSESADQYPLSADQLKFYRDNGYLVIRKLFGIQALDSYRKRFTDLCEGRIEKGRATVVKDRSLSATHTRPEDYINKIQELLYDEVYSTYSEDPRMLHIVTQLIGEDLTAVNCMLINKPPGTREHPPHQDLLYFPFRPAHKIVASWTAIDPVTRDNGCLYVLPGSHNPAVLHEHTEYVDQAKLFYFGLVDSAQLAPEHRRVDLEMEPGDTVFFQSSIVHGSKPNATKSYRKAMTCHYASSECHYIEVAGTRHEQLAKLMEAELRRRGGDLGYVDIWRIKTKQVKGVRSNL